MTIYSSYLVRATFPDGTVVDTDCGSSKSRIEEEYAYFQQRGATCRILGRGLAATVVSVERADLATTIGRSRA